jgi:hypothetical protein
MDPQAGQQFSNSLIGVNVDDLIGVNDHDLIGVNGHDALLEKARR